MPRTRPSLASIRRSTATSNLFGSACNTALMLRFLRLLAVPVIGFFRSRRDLLLENLALRQQLAVLKRRHSRPRLAATDRLFWVILRRFWSLTEACMDSRSAGYSCAMAPRRL